uniref:Uncharacterized protein n=1 Tax=viral metagenome TaxID=1070528 RepID=A0A6C0I7D0_9ZZZZ
MTRTKKHTNIKQKRKTMKQKNNILILPNNTPANIDEISFNINKEISNQKAESLVESYSPTINKELVLLQSVKREQVFNCNNEEAFLLKAPLQIGIPGYIYGNNCYPYNSQEAQKYLLKGLRANKHVNPDKIIPPIQALGNCWFNTMFVTLFVSDKGRKFFHFFRQLMIEGKQKNQKQIPERLKDGFALLNYAIDACLSGTKYAYIMNTNVIIKQIFDAIPDEYKSRFTYIKDIDEAGNPVRYYLSLINYLNNKDLQVLFLTTCDEKWQSKIIQQVNADKTTHLPHIIILEFFDDDNATTNKATSFYLNGAKYVLDSCVIRDTNKQHFSSLLTCEKKEMAYDGMSFHRLVYMDWKQNINSDFKWQFKGSEDNGRKLTWNFTKGYQMLVYYRS